MNDIIFEKAQGSLSRPVAGEDHYSGMLFFTDAALPAGFAGTRVNQILSLEDAEAKGITSLSADYRVLHYHISEAFRINPGIVLFVMVAEIPAVAYNFNELVTLCDYAEGKIKSIAVYMDSIAFAVAHVTALQTVINTIQANHMPLWCVFLTGNISAVADITTLPDLRALVAPNVSVVIGQDGGAAGAALYAAVGKTIGCLGAVLGAKSLAMVHENIGWPEKFKMSAVELDVPALGNGNLVKDKLAALETLNAKGYIFLKKHFGLSGTYLNDSHTAVALTSDYAYQESNSTIGKAILGVRARLLPKLNSPLTVDPGTGKLGRDTIKYFEELAGQSLEEMQRAGELSGYAISIDPDQNVVSTSELVIVIRLLVRGVARTIRVKIGLTDSL